MAKRGNRKKNEKDNFSRRIFSHRPDLEFMNARQNPEALSYPSWRFLHHGTARAVSLTLAGLKVHVMQYRACARVKRIEKCPSFLQMFYPEPEVKRGILWSFHGPHETQEILSKSIYFLNYPQV